jgi:hypothetical protein
MVNRILIKLLGGWNSWVKRGAFDTRAACLLPRLYRPVFWKDRNRRKIQSLCWTKCDQVRRVQNFSFQDTGAQVTLKAFLSLCMRPLWLLPVSFLSLQVANHSQNITSSRPFFQENAILGNAEASLCRLSIHYLFNNAVSNSTVNTRKELKVLLWMKIHNSESQPKSQANLLIFA